MIELKACPCCASKAEGHQIKRNMDISNTGYVVCCTNRDCGLKVEKWALQEAWAKEHAINAWNNRQNASKAAIDAAAKEISMFFERADVKALVQYLDNVEFYDKHNCIGCEYEFAPHVDCYFCTRTQPRVQGDRDNYRKK